MEALRNVKVLVGAVALAASVISSGGIAGAAHTGHRTTAGSYTFTSVSNPADPTFTQLLGINTGHDIAGYFGSGADAQHPNKGFTQDSQGRFTNENFPGSAQTQVIGIDDHKNTDGFYVDSGGATHGFVDIGGQFTTIDVPGTTFNQLLSLNNKGELAGYYQFGPSDSPTFVPYVHRPDGTFLLLPIANAQATSINDNDVVGGFSNDGNGNSHGYVWHKGAKSPLQVVDFPAAVSTQVLGVNDSNMAVGTYTDGQKAMHGFVYNWQNKSFRTVDEPNAKGSTVINGISKGGTIVGFYTDANDNTVGFIGKP